MTLSKTRLDLWHTVEYSRYGKLKTVFTVTSLWSCILWILSKTFIRHLMMVLAWSSPVIPLSKSNKKVLLRERKRHTARHVASACHAVLVGGVTYPGGGYLPWWRGTYPGGGGYLPWWRGGTYPGGGGVPTLVEGGTYPGGYLPWWRGYLPWWGVPTLVGCTYPGRYPPPRR